MQISIELSLYPLAQEHYKDDIWSFIKRLRAVEGLRVVTSGMSTSVFGDYDLAVQHVMKEMKHIHQTVGSAVFVCKFIGSDRSHIINDEG
ncbi:MAG: hypothetical protein ACSHW0_11825 [Thalassotalea sp.]